MRFADRANKNIQQLFAYRHGIFYFISVQSAAPLAKEALANVPTIEVVTVVQAPVNVCFDCARDIDLHMRSTAKTGERAIAGVTSGLIEMGEEVTWEAQHFGIRQRLTSRITAFDRPKHFRDSQMGGAFQWYDHDHFFDAIDQTTTEITDRFDYTAPLGWIGRIADMLFLKSYMRRLLEERARFLKQAAENLNLRDR